MTKLLRHLLAVAILPATVAGVVPYWIARTYQVDVGVGDAVWEVGLQALGIILLIAGLVLFVASLRRFFTDGEGTLAPWDPPCTLVVWGPYRFVRNPMISGVVMILFGEALTLLSLRHGTWAALFLAANLVYIPLIEEPQLARRFGDAYREYRRDVPRFIPRWRPWRG